MRVPVFVRSGEKSNALVGTGGFPQPAPRSANLSTALSVACIKLLYGPGIAFPGLARLRGCAAQARAGGASPAESCVRRAPLCFLLLPTIISFPSYREGYFPQDWSSLHAGTPSGGRVGLRLELAWLDRAETPC